MVTLRDDTMVKVQVSDEMAEKVTLCPRCKGSMQSAYSSGVIHYDPVVVITYYRCTRCNGTGIVPKTAVAMPAIDIA